MTPPAVSSAVAAPVSTSTQSQTADPGRPGRPSPHTRACITHTAYNLHARVQVSVCEPLHALQQTSSLRAAGRHSLRSNDSPSILVPARCQAGEQRNSSCIGWRSAPTHDAHARVGALKRAHAQRLLSTCSMGSVGMGVAVHVCMCVCSPMYVCMHDLKQVRIYVIVCACMYVGVRRWCTPDMRDMSVRIAQS